MAGTTKRGPKGGRLPAKKEYVPAWLASAYGIAFENGDRGENVVGDFNIPPFTKVIVRDIGLHSNRHLPWVARRRTGLERALFNPTWRLFASHDGPSGTFYSSKLGDEGRGTRLIKWW